MRSALFWDIMLCISQKSADLYDYKFIDPVSLTTQTKKFDGNRNCKFYLQLLNMDHAISLTEGD
jgi:hypothetical protein